MMMTMIVTTTTAVRADLLWSGAFSGYATYDALVTDFASRTPSMAL